ncbi:MAG: hypothetical protein QM765_03915 [Myxococcales bacterium]
MRRCSFSPAALCAALLGIAVLWARPVFAVEAAPQQKRLVLTELKSTGVKPELVRTLTDVLLESLRARSGMKVMGRTEVEVILEHEGQRQLLGCTDQGCEADLGAALKADYLCSGSLGLVGTTYLVNLALTEVKTARVSARASSTAMAAGELVAAVQRAAEDLVAPSDHRKVAAAGAGPGFKLTGKSSLAMLDLTASGLEPKVVDSLTQVVVDELKNLPKATLISRDEIRALFAHTRQAQLVGCDDAGCLSELGGALGVDYLVSGNVGRVGDTYLLHLKLISIKGAKIANRVAESFVGEEAQLIGATRFAARSLVGLHGDGEGQLEVPKPVSDARLLVDGRPVEGELRGPVSQGRQVQPAPGGRGLLTLVQRRLRRPGRAHPRERDPAVGGLAGLQEVVAVDPGGRGRGGRRGDRRRPRHRGRRVEDRTLLLRNHPSPEVADHAPPLRSRRAPAARRHRLHLQRPPPSARGRAAGPAAPGTDPVRPVLPPRGAPLLRPHRRHRRRAGRRDARPQGWRALHLEAGEGSRPVPGQVRPRRPLPDQGQLRHLREAHPRGDVCAPRAGVPFPRRLHGPDRR